MKLLLTTLSILLISAFHSNAQTWYQANNPFGGSIFEVHETSEGDLLCGTGRGLYKSSDNGETWQSISGDMDSFPVLDVKSTPSNTYISMFSIFLRRSTDGGENWETLDAVDWYSLSKIIVNDAGQIFISTDNSVWRSSDDGDNWTQLTIAENVSSLASFDISPDGDLFAGSYNSKIYRSIDNGDNWTELFTADNDMRTFAFDGDNTVYAGSLFVGLYKSEDNGDNWTELPALLGTNGVLDMNVNSSGEVFAAQFEGGMLKSTDGGMSWENITSDLIDPSVRKVFFNSSEELFAGTEAAGLQMNEGSTWTPKNQGISATVIERFVSIDGVLYACTGSGVFISEDGGTSWQQSIQGMDDKEILALNKAPNGDLYAGGEMLYYSEDGVNWNNISSGFPDAEPYVADILIESDGRVIVASEDYGIRYSDDQGQNWTNANSGLDDVTMSFIRKNAEGYYFTSDAENLYRSTDLSGTWEIINSGLTETDIEEFAVADAALFAVAYSDGLFKSTDNGDNWSLVIDEDFNNVTVNGSDIYASSESVNTGGVYFSEDTGETWSNIGDGLPNVQIKEVTYVQGQGLFTHVRDFGLYTLDFSVLGTNELSSNAGDITCFPNPFSGSATLRIVLEENAEIQISIFNLQGQIIQRSTKLNLSEGIHNIQIGNSLPEGVFLVKIKVGESWRTLRLVKGF